jgi:protein TonB
MLAYAPRREMQPARPGLFALIVLGHVGVIGAVMATKYAIEREGQIPTVIESIREPRPPEPVEPRPRTPNEPARSTIDTVDPIIPPIPSGPTFTDPPQPPIPSGPIAGSGTIVEPPLPPIPAIVRKGPVFITAADRVRPPYPDSMRASEKEARLRLRLSIDAAGRVTAVDPVGQVDPVFLDSARRHILKAWRYQPATEDGRPVPTTTTITLKFEIGDA